MNGRFCLFPMTFYPPDDRVEKLKSIRGDVLGLWHSFLFFPFNMAFVPGLYPFLDSKKSHGVDEFRIRSDRLHLVKRIPFVRQGIANLGTLTASNKWHNYIPISCGDLNVSLLHTVWPSQYADEAGKYRILRAMQKLDDKKYAVPVIKAILQNKETGAFLFVTGICVKPEEESVLAMAEGWALAIFPNGKMASLELCFPNPLIGES